MEQPTETGAQQSDSISEPGVEDANGKDDTKSKEDQKTKDSVETSPSFDDRTSPESRTVETEHQGDKPRSSDETKDVSNPLSSVGGGLTQATDASGQGTGGKLWMYIDGVNPSQHGPFPESIMLKLLRTGSAHKDMQAWSEGMPDWKPISQIDAFREISELSSTPWLYLGENGDQQGPVSAAALSMLFREGQLDGMTMAWTTGMGEWKPLSELSQLRTLLQDDEDDAAGDAAEMMVFEADEQEQPAYEPPPRKESKRSFMADDGTKFAWHEESGDWKEVEGSEDEELEDEEDEEEEHWKVRRASKQQSERAKKAAAKSGSRNGAAPKDAEDASGDSAHWGEIAEDVDKGGQDSEAKTGNGDEAGKEGNKSTSAQKKKKNKKKRSSTWNKKAGNLWVYIKGLPHDITADEVRAHFSKCGIIASDPLTQHPKIKIYKDDEGQPKGDGSVCYVKPESVDMAINVLHEGQIRPGAKIEVSKAVFEQKGDNFDNTKRLRLNDARVKVARAAAEQALSWAENDDTGAAKGGLKIVVVENMFRPSDFEANEQFGEELEADILAEGEKLGPVEKITVFSKNPKGPVVIKFGTAYAASECVKEFNGRFFGGRKLSCHFWDGVTNYTVQEEEEKDEERRLDAFGDWLEEQELPDELKPREEA